MLAILYKTIMVDTCHYSLSKPIECITLRVDLNVNYRLWVIMIWQCKFISYNKCTTLVQDVDSCGGRGGYACVGARVIWEISVL